MWHDSGTSASRRSLIEQDMAKAGVKPNFATYNILVRQLRFEGNSEETRAVVETEMPAAGVVSTDRTDALFRISESDLNKMRTRHVRALLQTQTPETTQQAHAFFEELKANGATDVFLWNVMQQLCVTSSAKWRMIEHDMVEAGVKPDVWSYNMLLSQLIHERKFEEVLNVVEIAMPEAGAVSDKRTHALLEKSRQQSIKRVRR